MIKISCKFRFMIVRQLPEAIGDHESGEIMKVCSGKIVAARRMIEDMRSLNKSPSLLVRPLRGFGDGE